MKKVLSLLCVFFFTSTSFAQFVSKHKQLRVEGTQLVDVKGSPVMLRGMSFGWHNWWPRFYNGGTVKWLKDDWKCNVVRAAMGIEPDKGYLTDKAGSLKNIRAVVDAAIKEDIYVIIDWHSHGIQLSEAKEFFSEMAKIYGKYPNVIYEIFNEPDKETWAEVKSYSEEIISAIRLEDPDNIILVGSPSWDQDIHLPAADPIKGANLMYTLHFYAATHKQWLRDRADAAIKSGLPIFVSESAGMEATGNGPLDLVEWQNWINWMEENKISWITWSVSDKDETCSVLKPSANSNGKWKDGDIKESGLRTREFLRKYNTE
jgi:endoglucanase